jgi:hypothetical protein
LMYRMEPLSDAVSSSHKHALNLKIGSLRWGVFQGGLFYGLKARGRLLGYRDTTTRMQKPDYMVLVEMKRMQSVRVSSQIMIMWSITKSQGIPQMLEIANIIISFRLNMYSVCLIPRSIVTSRGIK